MGMIAASTWSSACDQTLAHLPMDSLTRDVRFAFRTLLKQPAFTAAVVATLSLAIGASTAIFSVVESTLLRPLPFRSPERLVYLWGVAGPQRAIRGGSIIEVQDWGRLNRSFESLAIDDQTSLNLRTTEGADRVNAEMVSASFFPMLGATAQIGRVFTPDEDRVPDANPVVVISDGMWTSRFGRDPGIIGRTLTLNDKSFTVLGVMRPGFKGLSFNTDVWFPAMMAHANGAPADLTTRGTRWLGAVARLRDGVSIEAAQADMDRVAARLASEFPQANKDRGVQLFSLRSSYLGSTQTLFLAVFAAVGLLLMIACANVVGLQLVRASARRREFALRIAIGADRFRLAQQLVVEGLLLAAVSILFSLVVAQYALQGLLAVAPAGLVPNYAVPSINLAAFAFALVIAAGCGVIVGVVPALRGARVDLSDTLKEGTRGSATGFGSRNRLGSQQLLVVGETAVALVLLIGAGLYARSLQRQLAVSPGFDAHQVLRARFTFPASYSADARVQFANELRTRLAGLPSARDVAIASDLPLTGGSSASILRIVETDQAVRYYRHAVAPDFFRAMRIHVLTGRTFTADDRAGSPLVIVINGATARRFWNGQDPIGKTVQLGNDSTARATIVGVVDDVRYRDLTTVLATSEPDVYFSLAQRPPSGIEFAIRSDASPDGLAAPVRRELAAMDPAIALYGVQPLESLVAQQTATGRFASTALGVFALVAVLLTAIGLYGVLAFLVAMRRREIGIRLALGATRERVSGSIIGEGIKLVAIGVAVGVVVAFIVTRWIESQLFGVSSHDPAVFGSVTLLLLGVAGIASWLPSRRASRVDPQIALRAE
jgi:predicted permease